MTAIRRLASIDLLSPGALRAVLGGAVLCGSLFQTGATSAQERQNFDRGLTLFEQGDGRGALAALERAYALSRHPAVLFEICRVHIALNEPVKAVRALEELVSFPHLEAARRAEVTRLLAEQINETGTLRIASNVAGARITLDGADVGVLDEPERGVHPQRALLVRAGSHVLGLSAPGYLPARLEVTVARREEKAQLIALDVAKEGAGQIVLEITPVDTEVWLDGQLIGKTPDVGVIEVAPGAHRVELRRPGYAVVARDVDVGAQSRVPVDATLTPASTGNSGHLVVRVSEPGAKLTLDGVPLPATGTLVPAGEHALRVEQGGFVTENRVVNVRPSDSVVDVTLTPTAEYRAAYVERSRRRGFWGWSAALTGAVLTGAGAGYLIWSEGRTDTDTTLGWVLGGVGLASLGTGVYLLLTQEDPDRYEPKPRSDIFGSLSLSPKSLPQGGGLQLSGAF